MRTLKRITYSLLSLAITTSVITTADAHNRGYARCGGFYAQLEGFNISATDTLLSRLDYAFSQVTPTDTLTVFRLHNSSEDTQFGYRAAIGYDFSSCNCFSNYGASLEFTYFNTSQDARTPLDDTIVIIPSLSSLNHHAPTFFETARTSLDNRYDAVDLLAHKNLFFCNASTLQFFAGARYVHLKENLNANYVLPESVLGSAEENVTFNNKFNGIGPRIGANGFYNLAGGFGIAGEIGVSLVAGSTTSDYRDRLLVNNTVTTTEEVFVNKQHSANIMVPGLSGKAALAYHASFCNHTQLAVELGYRGDRYYGISDTSALVDSLSVPGELSHPSVNLSGNSFFQDFTFTGPYLAVTVHA